MKRKVIVKEYDAAGGPKKKGMGADGFPAGPTETGAYRVLRWGKHKSHRYPAWSSVRWGTPLKNDAGTLKVYVDGSWQVLSNYTSMDETDIKNEYERLYKTRRLPSAWVFNDFGHLTIYLYRDLDGDGKFDPGSEKVHGEFIHTTPDNEAEESSTGKISKLEESHGCIHIEPHAIDELVQMKYVKRNSRVFVHSYGAQRIQFPYGLRPTGPYELHIYPGIRRMVVIGREK